MKLFHKMLFKVTSRRLFYNTTKEVIEKHGNSYYVLQHYLEISAYFCYALRFIYVILSMTDPKKYSSLKNDFFTHLFSYFSTDRDVLYGVIMLMLFLSSIHLEKCIYFSRVDTPTWQAVYDEVVRGESFFRQSRYSKKVQNLIFNDRLKKIQKSVWFTSFCPVILQNSLGRVVTKVVIWYCCEFYNLNKIETQFKWKFIPEASVKLRAKMFIFTDVIETVNWILICFICK